MYNTNLVPVTYVNDAQCRPICDSDSDSRLTPKFDFNSDSDSNWLSIDSTPIPIPAQNPDSMTDITDFGSDSDSTSLWCPWVQFQFQQKLESLRNRFQFQNRNHASLVPVWELQLHVLVFIKIYAHSPNFQKRATGDGTFDIIVSTKKESNSLCTCTFSTVYIL